MKVYEYVGKNLEEAKEKALNELKVVEDDIYLNEREENGGLFKGKKIILNVLKKDDVISYIKEFINDVTKMMGITVNIEAKKRDEIININLFSDNNSILIGKNGKTIQAFQLLIRNSVQNITGFRVKIQIDVEQYKEKQHRNLEYNAKKIAINVKRTGVEVKLDPMNSYERRLVHSICNEIGGVVTESLGEEPNRYVVIKKKEEQ